jgi:hypothetical protein
MFELQWLKVIILFQDVNVLLKQLIKYLLVKIISKQNIIFNAMSIYAM